MNGGLSLEFELNQAKAGLRRGDVMVLSPAYETIWDGTPSGPVLWAALQSQPAAWDYVPDGDKVWLLGRIVLDDQPQLLAHDAAVIAFARLRAATVERVRTAARRAIGRAARPPDESAYVRSGFNEYGDQTSAWDEESSLSAQPQEPALDRFPTVQVNEAASALREFVEWCRDEGVNVVFAYPPVLQDWFRENEQSITRTSRMLESQLPITFINDPIDEARPPSDFFDMRYHLRGEAVRERTRDLLDGLLRYRVVH